jgi:DtxR family Mn-dependent transcriptional regulator
MGYSWEEVHDEACKLEHHISDKFELAIDELLNYPEKDPHGDPIPKKNGQLPVDNSICLNDALTGEELTIDWIDDKNPELLIYLKKMRVLPGAKITIMEKQPFGGSLVIMIDGQGKMLGQEAANNIFVNV